MTLAALSVQRPRCVTRDCSVWHAAVVEHPAADPHALQSRRATFLNGVPRASCRCRRGHQLPVALVPPEVGVVDRAVPGRRGRNRVAARSTRHEVDDAEERRRAARTARTPVHPRSGRGLRRPSPAASGRGRGSTADSRNRPMVRRLCAFLARSAAQPAPLLRWSNRASRSTVRGISKQGEPSSPTPSRTGPSRGTIDLGREEAVVAGPASAPGRRCRCRGSCGARSMPVTPGTSVLEKSALMTDSPSATIVPLPTWTAVRGLVLHPGAEVRPGLLDVRRGRTRDRVGSGRCRSCRRTAGGRT